MKLLNLIVNLLLVLDLLGLCAKCHISNDISKFDLRFRLLNWGIYIEFILIARGGDFKCSFKETIFY